MTKTVLTSLENGVRTLSLNRPERLNAINRTLLDDLKAALEGANQETDTRVVLLRGEGRAFCAGDDLKEFDTQTRSPQETRQYIQHIQDITRQIVLGDKFVIGAIHGWAVGGGFEWTINCDFVLMARGTRCFFPEISLGVFVTGGVTTLLPSLVGLQKAKELILLGERITAEEALELGIALKIYPQEELFSEAQSLAHRVAALPAKAVRNLKRVINRAYCTDVEAALALETEAAVEGFLDPETKERVGKVLL